MPKNKAVFQEKKYRYSWHIKSNMFSSYGIYFLPRWRLSKERMWVGDQEPSFQHLKNKKKIKFIIKRRVHEGTRVSRRSRTFNTWQQDQEKDPVKEPRWMADQEPSNQYLTNKFEEQEENRVEGQGYDQEKDQVGGSKMIWRSRTFVSTPEEQVWGSRGGYSGESSGSLWSREGFSWRDEGEWEIKYIAYLKNKFGDQEVD